MLPPTFPLYLDLEKALSICTRIAEKEKKVTAHSPVAA